MSKSRDLASLAGSATGLATDAELSAAVAGIDLTNVQRIVPVDSNISVPGAPTSVSGTVGNTQSSVSFVAPTNNGGSTILSYTVISSPGNIKKSGTTSPIVITGLTNGTAYTFTVKAHNIAGSSVASSASSSVTPAASLSVDYLVIAGGGGGGAGDGVAQGGGGGAGGLRSTVTATGGGGTLETALSALLNTNYTVTVGGGGAGRGTQGNGVGGNDSVFSTITSTAGGQGAYAAVGVAGGSGGGGGSSGGSNNLGGAGTANQGYAGGGTEPNSPYAGGGGGGAGGAGAQGVGGTNGARGAGVSNSITGTSVTYAQGGRAGTDGSAAGGNNTGTGGDGVRTPSSYAGGSGVVILRYLTADGTITIGAGLTGSTATDGSYKVTTITAGTGNVSWAV
jgi:hypothetical protein